MPTPDTRAEPTALVVEEDIVVRRLMHSGAPLWDSTMMIFLVPLSKREKVHQRANHRGDILIHRGAWCEYSGYPHGGFVRNVTRQRQRFLVVTTRQY